MTDSGILSEQRLTLLEAAHILNVHVGTLHRWALKGVKGNRLSTVIIGGVR